MYKSYLDKDIAFNLYFLLIPTTQIVPMMLLNKLGVCSFQGWGELLGSWIMPSPLLLFVYPVLCEEGDGCCVCSYSSGTIGECCGKQPGAPKKVMEVLRYIF